MQEPVKSYPSRDKKTPRHLEIYDLGNGNDEFQDSNYGLLDYFYKINDLL